MMLAEQLIFTFISLAIFVYMFFKMIKNNDTTYVVILILEAIGIAMNFIEFAFTMGVGGVAGLVTLSLFSVEEDSTLSVSLWVKVLPQYRHL